MNASSVSKFKYYVKSGDFVDVNSLSDSSVQLYLSNDESGMCIIAIYNSSGKMLTTGLTVVEANAGDVTITFSKFDDTQQYILWVFFVNQYYVPMYESFTKGY